MTKKPVSSTWFGAGFFMVDNHIDQRKVMEFNYNCKIFHDQVIQKLVIDPNKKAASWLLFGQLSSWIVCKACFTVAYVCNDNSLKSA